jgi:hypothetical protein
MPSLLLHLPRLFTETAVFGSALGLGCLLVVATVQVRADKTAIFSSTDKGWGRYTEER